MKSKAIMLVMLVALIAIIPMTLQVRSEFPGTRGPIMDVLRHKVVRSPDAALTQMMNHECDISPDQIRTTDIETQQGAGMLATQDLGFHMGYIAYNIRDTATINTIRTTLRGLSAVSHWPLHDVEFRHALVHSYDQLAIIPPIYGYVVTPVRSLVPPAQSKYYNAAVPSHPFNQGSPFTSPPGEHSTCGLLLDAGYSFVDAGTIGVVDDADYWEMPGGAGPVPYMEIWTPLEGDAPTSWAHGQEFAADLANVGLAATTANGNSGFVAFGRTFGEYLDDVFGTSSSPGGQFDAFMVFHGLARTPGQLYSFCHSSQDSYSMPPGGPWGLSNGPGCNDPVIDALTETVQYSLDPDAIEAAAEEVQAMLYTPDKTVYPNADNFAIAWMLMYSRAYTNVFTNDLAGAVRSPGYGSDNSWTYLNARWDGPGRYEQVDGVGADESVMVYINGLPPDSLNPCYATTAYEWNIITPNLDTLTEVNPFNHFDMPWIATDWDVTPSGGGMEIDLTLRSDVYWADGYLFDAYGVEFSWEFFRDWNTPNFNVGADALIDVVVTDATHLTIIADEPGLDLFYDYMGGGAVLPPQIWDRAWANAQAVLDYHPEDHAYGSDMATGYAVGPWAEPADPAPKVATNLFGTGPWIYQFYDETNDWDDEYANRNYFMTQANVQTLLTEMFWEVGDADRTGNVDGADHAIVSTSLGYEYPEAGYNADADFDSDLFVGAADFAISQFYLGWQKEYP